MDINIKTKVDFKVTMELTENEAKALEAIIGYGFKPFIEMFYKHMGKHYLQPYESSAKALFEKRQEITYQLYNIEQVREAVKKLNTNPGLEIEAERLPKPE